MVYSFLGKDEKTRSNLYLLLLNIIVEKKADIFP